MCPCGTASEDTPLFMQRLFSGAMSSVFRSPESNDLRQSSYPWITVGSLTHGVLIDYLPLMITIYFIQSPDLEFSPVSVVGSPNLIRSFLMTGWLALLSGCIQTGRQSGHSLYQEAPYPLKQVGYAHFLGTEQLTIYTSCPKERFFFFNFPKCLSVISFTPKNVVLWTIN